MSAHRNRRGPLSAATEAAAARVAEDLERRAAEEGLGAMLTTADACRLCDIHRATLFSWFAEGLPRLRVGRCVRVPVRELARWLGRRVLVG